MLSFYRAFNWVFNEDNIAKNKITVLNPILKLKSRKLKKLNLGIKSNYLDNNYMNQVQGLECMVNSFEELRLN